MNGIRRREAALLEEHLATDTAIGLSETEAAKRLQSQGPNVLEERKVGVLHELLEELREPMILLLLLVGVLYSIWGEPEDAATIFIVIFALIGVEVFNELRAEKTILALNQLSEQTAPVMRDGQRKEIPVRDLVTGDVLILEPGRRIAADAVVTESYGLAVDESALTGESVASEKTAYPASDKSRALAETEVFSGSVITRGRGKGVVLATGTRTELGRTASLARGVKPPKTPLQKTMNELTRWMVFLAIGFSILIPFLGWLVNQQSLETMILTGLSLAFATIPEELPIIITMVLALGGYRLSKQNAIVKRLQAVETLGSVTVIVTDKTGTLTSNRMEVTGIWPLEESKRILALGALCSDAFQTAKGFEGDPLDVALLKAAASQGIDLEALRKEKKLVKEFTFDNTRKMMSVVVEFSGRREVVAKGSPEQILLKSAHSGGDEAEEVMREAAQMASNGLRVLGIATKEISDQKCDQAAAEAGLIFVGLLGFSDPPRREAKGAISDCYQAGIRVMMVTGDHPLTALSVAKQIGLDATAEVVTGQELDDLTEEELQVRVSRASVFARTTPSHKLRIVQSLQKIGERVAVTGDGINDAPALAAADIGVAMGEGGTDVAREAADMVLADNNFATISHAVREGRKLYANLRKGVRYYLACKVALIASSLIAVLVGAPIPFTPVQIILLELFMDLGASAAFVSEKEESDIMERPPQDSRARFLDRPMISSIFSSAAGLFLAVSVAYLAVWYSTANLAQAQTTAFVSWLLGHVLLAFNMRSDREPLFKLGALSNGVMLIWGMAAGAFALLVTLLPAAQSAFKTTYLPLSTWIMLISLSLAGSFWIEVWKWASFGRKAAEGDAAARG